MTYKLEQINDQAARDPKGFIEGSERRYHTQVEQTAASIVACMKQRPIVLLNGPSSSGKTTTARLLGEALMGHGVHAEVISMDDYYRTRSEYQIPKDEEGVDDFESPLCMDLPLLNDHLQRLAAGEEICVPHFDFEKQSRTDEVECLSLDPDEVAVIEGIHSFSDTITGGLEDKATCLYLSVASSVSLSDGTVLAPEMLRFMRRAIRDRNFRGAPVEATLRQWRSVRRGERLYIAPYRHHATQYIDSYLPYESCILMQMLQAEIAGREEEMRAVGLHEVFRAIGCFAEIDYQPYLPENSVLHEFIG
ncbi:nucleoside kinase [Intestinibacillus massiliensis]|nr:nucleoside kinase [Intestinibacillus massiliensis]